MHHNANEANNNIYNDSEYSTSIYIMFVVFLAINLILSL